MNARSVKDIRCAIYTRVSTDSGLDQDFNSLDAPDAAQAYIRSQAHAGWTLVRRRYDDGGFSGGSTDRPALQQLLADIRSHKVDVIVVYKVDRLTRSLADFAKLVELFDAHQVSFVSVTQQFNTTTSMGRLTLNVLLSFAQFEREVTSERIRDKIGASKRKGLWVGGVVPLGYQAKDRKITVVEEEAKIVRHIFRRYLELGSLNLLLADLRTAGIKTKVRPLSTGRIVGGIPFTRGSLGYLLRNRFYVGEVRFKGEVFAGEQAPILDRKLFDGVQERLDQQRINQSKSRYSTDSPLTGRIFDASGNRMTPTYVTKKGVRYRYYVSSALIQGRASEAVEPKRLSAVEIEALIVKAIGDQLKLGREAVAGVPLTLRHVARVDVTHASLKVTLAADITNSKPENAANADPLIIPYKKNPLKRPRELLAPNRDRPASYDGRPIRSETRIKLLSAIAKGRIWLDEFSSGVVTSVDQIAARENCSIRQVNMTISLAFLAPTLVAAAIDGRLPRGIGVANLRDAPLEWSSQLAMLGLAF